MRFLKDEAGLLRHMDAHRALLAPKFEAVINALETRLAGTGAAEWTRPEGGYFISVDATAGTARQVVALAHEAGLALTPAGATWPHGRDPDDRNLRLAPTYPPLADVRVAVGRNRDLHSAGGDGETQRLSEALMVWLSRRRRSSGRPAPPASRRRR